MAIERSVIRRVAKLAGLHVPEDALDGIAQDMGAILGWIEQLDEVDVDGVEPMTTVVTAPAPFRDDVVTEGGDPEAVLANAPCARDNYFVVPRVLD